MQDYPDYYEPLTEDESAETPNWVADAGITGSLVEGRAPYVRYAREGNDLQYGGPADYGQQNLGAQDVRAQGLGYQDFTYQDLRYQDLRYQEIRRQLLIQEYLRRQEYSSYYQPGNVQERNSWQRHYDSNAPQTWLPYQLKKGDKPYDDKYESGHGFGGDPAAAPDPRPLDEQFKPPMGLPLPDAAPKATQPKLDSSELIREGNKVILPTFSLGDPDLDATHSPKLKPFDSNSPEAKLYIENRDSIVKITTDKVNSDGKTYNAWASGFFVTENGQIATANHVIDGAQKITVETADGRKYNARVKQSHPGSESAVIELTDLTPGEKFRTIPLRDSAADLKPGEKLTVLGHPNGVDEIVMSNGEFKSRERFAGTPFDHPNVNPSTMFLHASTRIQGGNSGGPILDSQGRAVGLTNFRHNDNSGEFVGIDDVRSMVTDPKQGQLFDKRSYFVPSTLQFDKGVALDGLITSLGTVGTASAYLGRGGNYIYATSAARGFTTVGMASIGLMQMPGDFKAFKSSWEHGSTAEKVSSGIDLGGDVLMVAGSVAALASKRYAIAGSLISTIGAGSKLGNSVLGDRRFH